MKLVFDRPRLEEGPIEKMIFTLFLKAISHSASVMFCGRVFHSKEAAITKLTWAVKPVALDTYLKQISNIDCQWNPQKVQPQQ